MLDPIGIIKIAETKGVATTDRFSKLYKESAVAKKLSRNFQQLFKSQKAVEANGNGTSGIKITEGGIKENPWSQKQRLKSFKFSIGRAL